MSRLSRLAVDEVAAVAGLALACFGCPHVRVVDSDAQELAHHGGGQLSSKGHECRVSADACVDAEAAKARGQVLLADRLARCPSREQPGIGGITSDGCVATALADQCGHEVGQWSGQDDRRMQFTP